MGYTTDFKGIIKITPEPTEGVRNFVNGLQNTRRMKRDPSKLPKRIPKSNILASLNGGWGDEGEFYFNPKSTCSGQENTKDIVDYNNPPESQPSLWLQWEIVDDYIQWNGAEKFYGYTEWLIYLIEKIFQPLGYTLNGKIFFIGEDAVENGDIGKIVVENNKVTKTFFDVDS